MAPSVAQTARIFEDPEPTKSPKKSHNHVPSVGDVLRGRKKESTSPTKERTHKVRNEHLSPSPSPLGERHINSPPQPKKIPLKDAAGSRPSMHKKSGSATSFRDLIMGREKSSEGYDASAGNNEADNKPKKNRSSTNLAGLLKKRSKKDLKEKSLDISAPPSPTKASTPIWAQFATQPMENLNGSTQYPKSLQTQLETQVKSTAIQNNLERTGEVRSSCEVSPCEYFDLKPPQRPYLDHRNSRSSIFTEELDDNDNSYPDASGPNSPIKSESRPTSSRQLPDLSTSSMQDAKSFGKTETKAKRSSKVLNVISTLNMRTRLEKGSEMDPSTLKDIDSNSQDLDSALENVLGRYDIPQNLRDHMRNLKPEVKAGLVKGERIGSGSSTEERTPRGRDKENERPTSNDSDGKRSRSRSRPRSLVFTMSKKNKDSSPTKQEGTSRSRSKSRPKSVDLGTRPLSALSNGSTTSLASSAAPDSTHTPGDFIHYLREMQKPELIEVGKVHKLRILLRNESVQWTDMFVRKGGMDEIVQLLYRIMKIEWREEHEDNLLHETLLCMKALSTTNLAMQRMEAIQHELFPAILKMLFDPERKGPAEFSTRAVIISLIFSHLSATLNGPSKGHQERTKTILEFMKDPAPEEGKQPLDFVSQMHTARPYRVWCKEISNVTKEVFWIFLHHMNVVPIEDPNMSEPVFAKAYYPKARAPHPAAPYVGGVEWEATQYLATHLDLLNGLIVSMPTLDERNQLREDLRQSGFEKVMGCSLRTCKEKFYGGVHDGLRAWVAAAKVDGWQVEDVRAGPPREASSPKKSPTKKKFDESAAPQLDLKVPMSKELKKDDGWL